MARWPPRVLLLVLLFLLSTTTLGTTASNSTANQPDEANYNDLVQDEAADLDSTIDVNDEEDGSSSNVYKGELSRERALITAYLPKPFALLSMICSYTILREVVADQRSKKGGPIPRMLFSMAVADLFFSLGLFLGTWAAPPVSYQDSVGNSGNQASCTFQGFCIQLGYVASVLANSALSFYYLWIVRYGWTDSALAKVEPWVQSMLWILALIAAIYPIPMELYNLDVDACWLASVPPECSGDTCLRGSDTTYHHMWLFLLAILCLFTTTSIMISIFLQVRKIENKSKKYATYSSSSWSKEASAENPNSTDTLASSQQVRRSRVSRRKSIAVAKQGIFFALAFLLTYSLSVGSAIAYQATGKWSDVLDDIAYSVLLPFAGAFNFVVFARPRTEMKTPEGRLLRSLWFCSCCGSREDSLEQSSSPSRSEPRASNQGEVQEEGKSEET